MIHRLIEIDKLRTRNEFISQTNQTNKACQKFSFLARKNGHNYAFLKCRKIVKFVDVIKNKCTNLNTKEITDA